MINNCKHKCEGNKPWRHLLKPSNDIVKQHECIRMFVSERQSCFWATEPPPCSVIKSWLLSEQGWQYGTVRKYDTLRSNFKPKVRYVGTVRLKNIHQYVTLVRYGTVNFAKYWYGVRTCLSPTSKQKNGTVRAVRFALIFSQRYGTYRYGML